MLAATEPRIRSKTCMGAFFVGCAAPGATASHAESWLILESMAATLSLGRQASVAGPVELIALAMASAASKYCGRTGNHRLICWCNVTLNLDLPNKREVKIDNDRARYLLFERTRRA